MGASESKPKNKTGKNVARQKMETASKTGVLSLNGHNIVEVPSKVFELYNLRTLDFSNNSLKTLPIKLTALTQLKSLNCDRNRLRNSGISPISKLTKLQALSLSSNRLGEPAVSKNDSNPGEINAPFPSLPSGLKQLKIDSNHFTSIPATICSPNLVKLEKLDISRNNLAVIPSEISNLVSLTELNLDGNCVVSLPKEVGKLRALKSLSLQNNQIRVDSTSFSTKNPQPLPAALFTGTPLIDLNLRGNRMTNTQLNEFEGFPDFLERRKNLKSKNIYGGALTDLGVCGLD